MVIGGNFDAYAYYRPVQYQGSATYADPRFGNRAFSMTDPEAAKGTQMPANPDKVKKPGRRSTPEECETCKERKYQDGSDENVSFKSAQHISPESAASRVRAHEQEHVANAYKKAAQNNGKVVQASVSLKTAVCPECGRTYVAGGETSTQIKYYNEENPYQKDKKSADSLVYSGMNVDASC